MDPDAAALLVEFVEKAALLRRDVQQKGEMDRYAARFARMEQKLLGLAEQVERADPDLAKRLRSAWARPVMSLAYRNAEHQKEQE